MEKLINKIKEKLFSCPHTIERQDCKIPITKTPLKFSIITVCKNAETSIEKTIQSALIQTYEHIEYIIIDGKSTDNTQTIIEKYCNNISTVISEEDNGIYEAMNKGLSIATGDIIQFLNADDYLIDENVISDMAHQFQKNPQVEILYGKARYINVPKKLKTQVESRIIAQNKQEWLLSAANHQCIFVKRSVFDQIGCFNEKYKIYADFDFFLRCFHEHTPKKYIDQTIVCANYQGTGFQKRKFALHEKLEIIFKHTTILEKIIYLFKASVRYIYRIIHR